MADNKRKDMSLHIGVNHLLEEGYPCKLPDSVLPIYTLEGADDPEFAKQTPLTI